MARLRSNSDGHKGVWAEALATVAIASLSGPVAALGTAVDQIVRVLSQRWRAELPVRQLQQQLAVAIMRWAKGEQVSSEVCDLGLELASTSLARFGADLETIGRLNYDPAIVASYVIEAARRADPGYWGSEDHYTVAERAIRYTYTLLIEEWNRNEPILFPAILAAREQTNSSLSHIEQQLGVVNTALTSVGSIPEIISYLKTRARDWDDLVWLKSRQSSTIERPLRVRTRGSGAAEMSLERARAGAHTLVLLGGPGSGKSWLARRLAREAALAALTLLEGGASLADVQIPVLTTWDRWAGTPGGTRESIVASSFAAGAGHTPMANEGVDRRLQRLLTDQTTRVLAVIDSLDEAAATEKQGNRLRELVGLGNWLIVVTSRMGAWEQTTRGRMDDQDDVRVAELQPLSYPQDVKVFIKHWFDTRPERGQDLSAQLRHRPELARSAVVPLLLTFFCLIADSTSPASNLPLPSERHKLYDRLIKRLLAGEWTSDGPADHPQVAICFDVLRLWAWDAVRDANRPSGLGTWGDHFVEPAAPPLGVGRALERVVAQVDDDHEGAATRRFVHRSLLEHLVASYVSELDVKEAADVLLPHLWFDGDWAIAAPAAVAAHNRRQKGVLMSRLVSLTGGLGQRRMTVARPHPVADSQLDDLVLAIAYESNEEEWSADHRDLINRCRVRCAPTKPELVMRSTHWQESNAAVNRAILVHLPVADSSELQGMVSALVGLGLTPADRAAAEDALLTMLVTNRKADRSRVASALTELDMSDAHRRDALNALLAALPAAHSLEVARLVSAIRNLGPTLADRTTVCHVLRAALASNVDDRKLWALGRPADYVSMLIEMEPSPDAAAQTRNLLLVTATTSSKKAMGERLCLLNNLDPTPHERTQARAALLAALLTAEPWDVESLASALIDLSPSVEECAEARRVVLATIPVAESWYMGALVLTLIRLGLSVNDRSQVVESVLTALPLCPARWAFRDLVAALLALDPTLDERVEGQDALLMVMSTLDSQELSDVEEIASAFIDLDPTPRSRAEARRAILDLMPRADGHTMLSVIRALSSLAPSEQDNASARAAILAVIHDPSPYVVEPLVRALVNLDPTPDECQVAVEAALIILPESEIWHQRGLVRAIRELSRSDQWIGWLASYVEAVSPHETQPL